MTYVEIWTWSYPVVDLTGFDVEATDGHIGKIDEATYDAGSSCLVVDTGWWIFGKKRMLPAGVVERVEPDTKQVFLRCSKDQVKEAPDFDEVRRDEASYREELGDYWTRR
ncbi:MAG TPA: PRC-barrel domain containing protein [Acidimicrobiia bacterium]